MLNQEIRFKILEQDKIDINKTVSLGNKFRWEERQIKWKELAIELCKSFNEGNSEISD